MNLIKEMKTKTIEVNTNKEKVHIKVVEDNVGESIIHLPNVIIINFTIFVITSK